MSDDTSGSGEPAEGARMALTPETIHEGDGEQFLDCPQCGSPASLTQIIETGRCTGQLDAEETETYAEDQRLQETGCTADLSLELVWEA